MATDTNVGKQLKKKQVIGRTKFLREVSSVCVPRF